MISSVCQVQSTCLCFFFLNVSVSLLVSLLPPVESLDGARGIRARGGGNGTLDWVGTREGASASASSNTVGGQHRRSLNVCVRPGATANRRRLAERCRHLAGGRGAAGRGVSVALAQAGSPAVAQVAPGGLVAVAQPHEWPSPFKRRKKEWPSRLTSNQITRQKN
jgi:hypothetical protein